MMNKRKRMTKKIQQKNLGQNFIFALFVNLMIILVIAMIIKMTEVSGNNQNEGGTDTTVYESITIDHDAVIPPANASDAVDTTIETEEVVQFSRNLSEEDKYLLAKIAMAEAEGESLETKVLVILTILNRVETSGFPNTIEGVIFESSNGVYQFSPVMPGGRWWTTNPNEECWEAVEIVNTTKEDASCGALFFEACIGESWHSRNLEFICQSDKTRFYK